MKSNLNNFIDYCDDMMIATESGVNNEVKKARDFVKEVDKLAKRMGVDSYFIVTRGASGTKNNNCAAVRNARDSHIKWELENGHDPYEDWGKK